MIWILFMSYVNYIFITLLKVLKGLTKVKVSKLFLHVSDLTKFWIIKKVRRYGIYSKTF